MPTCGLNVRATIMSAKLPALDLSYTLRVLQQAFAGHDASVSEEGDDDVRFIVARFPEHAVLVLFASGKLIVSGCKTEWEALMAMNTVAGPLYDSMIPCVVNTALTEIRVVNMIAKRYMHFKIDVAALKRLNNAPPHGVNEQNGMIKIKQWRGFDITVDGQRREKYACAQVCRGGLVLITGVASMGELKLFDAAIERYLRMFADADQSQHAGDDMPGTTTMTRMSRRCVLILTRLSGE